MIAQPKTLPFRSKKYLEFVRAQNCCSCGWPATLGEIQAHHIETNGMATKCGDDLTVPLCSPNARGCHARADKSPDSAEGYRPIAERLFKKFKGAA